MTMTNDPQNPQHAAAPAPAGGGARIAQIRRRRHLRHFRFALVCLLLAVLLAAYFTGILGAPMAKLGEWAESARILLTPGEGFPVVHGVEQVTRVQPFSGGMAVLGKSELVLYAENGNELRRIPHGFDRASISTGGTRVCIYNRGAKQLQVEGRTRTFYSETTEEPITLAAMAQNGALAIATKTKLTVYNTLYEPVWTWNDSNETPVAMTFSGDNRHLATACLYAEGGALGTKLYFFDTKSNKLGPETIVADGLALQMQYLSRGRLLVVYDTFTAVYNTSTGEETARYDYGNRVLQSAAPARGAYTALLFGLEGYTSLSTLVVLNEDMEESGTVTAKMRADSVAVSADAVHVLADTKVYTFGFDGLAYGETELSEKPLGIAEGRVELMVTTQALTPFNAPGRPQKQRPQAPQSTSPASASASASTPPSGTGVPSTESVPAPGSVPAA